MLTDIPTSNKYVVPETPPGKISGVKNSPDNEADGGQSQLAWEQRNISGKDQQKRSYGVDSIHNLTVTGSEFLECLKESLLELDVDLRSRNEMLALAKFLVAFNTCDKHQTLQFKQLIKLVFTFRIESMEKTRKGLFSLIQSDSDMPAVRNVPGGYLIPTDSFVNYLKNKVYEKKVGTGMKIAVQFSASLSACASAMIGATAAAADSGGGGATYSTTGMAQINTWNSATRDNSTEPLLPFAPSVRRQDLVRGNFLHFLINMFARRVPGNLFYQMGTSDGSLSEMNDFYCCIQFLQATLLKNPMNLDGVYEKVWENFQRLSREGEKPSRDSDLLGDVVRTSDIKLYCLPIIGNNWGSATQKFNARAADLMDKKSFVRVCHDCII